MTTLHAGTEGFTGYTKGAPESVLPLCDSQWRADGAAPVDQPLALSREQLQQSEKMASIGQLAAGVAHEINNPIGYVHSNLGSLQEYLHSLFSLIEVYERALRLPDPKAMLPEIEEMRARYDIDFITGDLPQLMSESREGIERVLGVQLLPEDVYYITGLPTDLQAGDVATIAGVALAMAFVATLYPAWRAARTAPAEALRYE